MKQIARFAALAVTLAMSTAYAQQADTSKPPSAPAAQKFQSKLLNRAELDALLAKPDQLVVIDLRRPDELTTKGGFPVYLSIQAKNLEQSLPFIPRDRTIVTVSNHAGRAGPAADLLASKGFKVAGAVGTDLYEQEGGLLTRITPPPQKTADANATPR